MSKHSPIYMKSLDVSQAKAWLTEGKKHRLSPLPVKPKKTHSGAEIFVDLDHPRQTIEGFGGAITESSAFTLAEMPASVRKKVLQAFFDPKKGNGFTLCRTHINTCDFSLDFHACAEKPGDTSLSSFNLEREKKWVIPFIRAAAKIAGRKISILASPWSPPAWMKSTGKMEQGGKLLEKYKSTWANYYVRFIQEMGKEKCPIWAITVQNEPEAKQTWESCIYTAEDERDFVRDHLGPALWKAGLKNVHLVIWDHNRDRLFQRAKTVYDDARAAKYVWGAAMHWYMGHFFENAAVLHEAYPDKRLIFTEGCVGGWNKSGQDRQVAWGENYGANIIADLNRWTCGWIDWNLILNETTGPQHAREPGCVAPVMYDRKKKKADFQMGYYYMGHFSRFIRPGARGLITAKSSDHLDTTAAVNKDGSVAVVVLNRTDNAIPFYITSKDNSPLTAACLRGEVHYTPQKGESIPLKSPAHSIITVLIPPKRKR